MFVAKLFVVQVAKSIFSRQNQQKHFESLLVDADSRGRKKLNTLHSFIESHPRKLLNQTWTLILYPRISNNKMNSDTIINNTTERGVEIRPHADNDAKGLIWRNAFVV